MEVRSLLLALMALATVIPGGAQAAPAHQTEDPFEWRSTNYKSGAYPSVRLLALLVDGRALLNRNVTVVGVLSIAHEDTRLYLSKEDYGFYNTSNSIYLSLGTQESALKSLQGRYVQISGKIVEDGSSLFPNGVRISDVARVVLGGPLRPRQ